MHCNWNTQPQHQSFILFYLKAENNLLILFLNLHLQLWRKMHISAYLFFRCTKRKKKASYTFYSLLSLKLSIWLTDSLPLPTIFLHTFFPLQTHAKRLITFLCSFLFPLFFTHAIFTSIHSRKKRLVFSINMKKTYPNFKNKH